MEKENLIKEVDGYEISCHEYVETILEGLRAERDSLEEAVLSCRKFIREHHVTEIIKVREEKAKDLEKVTKFEMSTSVLMPYRLVKNGKLLLDGTVFHHRQRFSIVLQNISKTIADSIHTLKLLSVFFILTGKLYVCFKTLN